MRFYTQQHQYYCGIDLHARSLYLCILDQAGQVLVHRNMQNACSPPDVHHWTQRASDCMTR